MFFELCFQPSGATFDFELPSASECILWVYALRCLQLRSHGFGLYSLSRLAVKFERVGFKLKNMAARESMTPREYLDMLRAMAMRATRDKGRDGKNTRAVENIAMATGIDEEATASVSSDIPANGGISYVPTVANAVPDMHRRAVASKPGSSAISLSTNIPSNATTFDRQTVAKYSPTTRPVGTGASKMPSNTARSELFAGL